MRRMRRMGVMGWVWVVLALLASAGFLAAQPGPWPAATWVKSWALASTNAPTARAGMGFDTTNTSVLTVTDTNLVYVTNVFSYTNASGDGSGLTNLNPSAIAAGTAPINITGNAATASSVGPPPTNGLLARYCADLQTGTNGQWMTNIVDVSGNNYTAISANPPKLAKSAYASHSAFRFEGHATVAPQNNVINLPTNIVVCASNSSVFIVSRAFLPNTQSWITIGNPSWYTNITYRGEFSGGLNKYYVIADGTSTPTMPWAAVHPAGICLHGFRTGLNETLAGRIAVDYYIDRYACRMYPIGALVNWNFSGGYIGSNGTDDYTLSGDVFDVLIYNRSLSDHEVEQLRAWAMAAYGIGGSASIQVACVGDSIIGGGGSGYDGIYINEPLPAHLQERLGAQYRTYNFGYSGQLINTITAGFTNSVASFIGSKNYARNYVVLEGGVNDLIGGATAAAAYTNFITLAKSAKATGAYVIAMTTCWSGGTAAAFNTLIKDSLKTDAGVDQILDAQADPRLASGTSLQYYQSDHVHPNDAGAAVYAELLARTIVTNAIISPFISQSGTNVVGDDGSALNGTGFTNGAVKITGTLTASKIISAQHSTGGAMGFNPSGGGDNYFELSYASFLPKSAAGSGGATLGSSSYYWGGVFAWNGTFKGVTIEQVPWIPTNRIPVSTATITNYVLCNLSNNFVGGTEPGGIYLVATNLDAAGSFILQKVTTSSKTWP